MQMRRSPGARPLDREWHENRQRARETATNGTLELFFSDTEIIKYELETARITGAENPRVYTFRRAIDIFGVNGTDVRELRDR
jgi:hypothetical protein